MAMMHIALSAGAAIVAMTLMAGGAGSQGASPLRDRRTSSRHRRA